MIEGRVNARLEATLSLDVRRPGGPPRTIEAVVDTGYSEFLTLPPDRVGELGLTCKHQGSARLADGSEIVVRPTHAITDHSGAGRVARLRMRPVSLFESGDSAGLISLSELLDGGPCRADPPELDLDRITELVCRGGFPRFITMEPADASDRMRDYLRDIAMLDVQGSEASHHPLKMLALITSLGSRGDQTRRRRCHSVRSRLSAPRPRQGRQPTDRRALTADRVDRCRPGIRDSRRHRRSAHHPARSIVSRGSGRGVRVG